MPCRSDDYEPESEDSKMRREIDRLTQDLCYLCGEMTEAGVLKTYASQRILAWWEKHKKADLKRVKEGLKGFLFSTFTMGQFSSMKSQNKEQFSKTVFEHLLNSGLAEHPISTYHKKWFKALADECAETHVATYSEDVKQKALNKLTSGEKKALGLID